MRKWKTFVRGPGLYDESYPTESNRSESSNSGQSYVDGKRVHEIYEQIISEPSSAAATSSASFHFGSPPISIPEKEKPQKQTLAQLMKICDSNGVKALEEYMLAYSEETDINACDQFGWTLLMTAAVANSYECVELLLRLGSDWNLSEKGGLNAFELARKHRCKAVCLLIQDWIENQGDRQEGGHNEGELCEVHKELFCEPCGVAFKDTHVHDKSIAHLFSTESHTPSRTHYGIPECNRGFQLMLKTGWDRGGLGQSGEGQKFPVKTVLKRDRKGLGNDKVKKTAKVTHFDPFDIAAVKSPQRERIERTGTVKKSEAEKSRSKERIKEINFRRDFHAE